MSKGRKNLPSNKFGSKTLVWNGYCYYIPIPGRSRFQKPKQESRTIIQALKKVPAL